MLKDFDLKGWAYKGQKLNNPALILWKVFWWVPLQVFLVLTCLCALAGFGSYAAKSIWREVN